MRRVAVIAVWSLLGAVWAQPAAAELVVFQSGRNLSAKGHRFESSSIIIELRDGGEIACDRAVVAEILPDEVPYPEPEVPRAADAAPIVPFDELIDSLAAEHSVDARLVRAVIQVESGFHHEARSRKGAMGLMQLMPQTARQYAVSDPYDPRSNIEGGIKHLKTLLARYDLAEALAAYNAGEGAVQRFKGIPPFAETRGYVSQILRLIGR